ncbi:hypothetical protein OIU78_022263, partial [Salix suchowensis]
MATLISSCSDDHAATDVLEMEYHVLSRDDQENLQTSHVGSELIIGVHDFAGDGKRRWTMVSDTASLVGKESRKSLKLLQGLKRTHMDLFHFEKKLKCDHLLSNGADMNMKRKRSREDHVLNPLMNSYEGCSEGKIYRLLRMREQMIKLDDKKKEVVEDFGKRLHLIHLLRITSTEADESNVGSALENLKELYQSVSLIGDSVQRV